MGHAWGMLIGHSNNGGQAKLWCVELIPKKRLSEAEMKRARTLAKGMPSDPKKAMLWIAEAMAGFKDNREVRFARDRQRLVVFTEKKQAEKRAKKETNQFWWGKVRPVKIV